jgi:EAL domain-containing protein (putative c-di-GMP-specific phosphodiesterase class I)
LALDDFGTGYSSLSYLRRFPFDKIKIDRSFIKDLDEAEASTIVEAVVKMASACHMTTTAEGVETMAQRNMLRALGCNQMQGYLFSPPISPTELQRVLKASTLKRAPVARVHDA